MTAVLWRLGLLACMAVAAGCTERTRDATASSPARRIRVQFGWTLDAHHVGFILANRLGYYTREGLNVTLIPGGLDSSPVRSLVSGGAEIAQVSGAEQVLAARAEELPIQAIAAFHRTSPHALISLAERPIRSPDQLRGKTVAVAFGDSAEFLLRDLLAASRLDDRVVTLTPFRFDLSPLIRGDVTAITGFATDQPFTLQAQGHPAIVLPYGDARQTGYGYMLVARSDASSDGVAAFLRASRRGWSQAFADPRRAVDVLLREVPSLNRSVELAKLQAVRQLMVDRPGPVSSWCMDADIFASVHRRMIRYHQLRAPVALAEAFSNEYCAD